MTRKPRSRASSGQPVTKYGPDAVYQIATDKLRPYENNPRHNEAAVDAVAASIRSFGFRVPIILDSNFEIVAGHTRWAAAKQLGLPEVPCMFATDISEEQIRAYRLVDNKTAELADWDQAKFLDEIAGLDGLDIALTDYGWAQKELDDLVAAASAATASAPPRNRNVATEAAQTKIQIGDIVFFLPKAQFAEWVTAVQEANAGNRDRMILDLAHRLGFSEAYEAKDSTSPISNDPMKRTRRRA